MITTISGVDEFNAVEHLMVVAKLRYEIAALMKNYDLIEKVEPASGVVNSFRGRIEKNPHAALGVEFFDGILPECIYSAFGAFDIFNASNQYKRLTTAFLSDEEKASFLRRFISLFQAYAVEPATTDLRGETVKQPAVYGVRKVPGINRIFPERFELLPENMRRTVAQVNADERQIAYLINMANQELHRVGHPELMFQLSRDQIKTLVVDTGRENNC